MKGHKTICAKTKVHPWEAINGNQINNNNNSEHDSFMQHAPFICILSFFLKFHKRSIFTHVSSLEWQFLEPDNLSVFDLHYYFFVSFASNFLQPISRVESQFSKIKKLRQIVYAI
jgi:hypothetical protein